MQAFNPYLPNFEYIPDGEPYVFGSRLYVYGSHDRFNGRTFCENDYVCWSAPISDLGSWRNEGILYRKQQDPEWKAGNTMYAPDVTLGPDGRYYLFYTLDCTATMAVAVGDSPTGPFSYYGRVHYPDGSVFGRSDDDYYAFDPAVLVDTDGRIWLYSGFGYHGPEEIKKKRFGNRKMDGGYCMELEKDMLTIRTKPVLLIPNAAIAGSTPFAAHPFFEASSIRHIGDLYYLVYSSSFCHELCYAVSRYPNRDFLPGGPIVSNGDVGLNGFTMEHPCRHIGNNHGGMVKIGEQWYIFYHRHTNYSDFSRQGCAEPIDIEENGTIHQVECTSCGLNGGPLSGTGTYSASIACQIYNTCANSTLPDYTQDGEDREADENQYITGLKNGSVTGFKYFDLSAAASVAAEVRGSSGVFLVFDRIGGRLLARIPFCACDSFTFFSAPMQPAGNSSGLFFLLETTGSVDFRTLILSANSLKEENFRVRDT